MQKIKYIIFDCDGVLIDSELIANRVEVEEKKRHGIILTLEEQLKKFIGLNLSDPTMIEEMKRLPANYQKDVHAKIKVAYHSELKAIDGVIETMKKIRLPKCVASNSDQQSLLFKLKLTGLDSFFEDAAFSADMVNAGKPAPDLFLHAVKKMSWDPSHCLVVEDSVAGVTAAKAAGLKVCGFTGGGHMYPGHAEKLINTGTDYMISDFRELLKLL